MRHWGITCTVLFTVIYTVYSQCNPINDHCCAYPQFGQISCSYDRGRTDKISQFPGRRSRLPLNAWMYTEIYMGSNCVVEWDPPDIQDNYPRLKFFVWDDTCNQTCIPPPPIQGAVLMNICVQDNEQADEGKVGRMTLENDGKQERTLNQAEKEEFLINDIINLPVINDVVEQSVEAPITDISCKDEWRADACVQVINGSSETCLNDFIRKNCQKSCDLCVEETKVAVVEEICMDEMDEYLCRGLRPVHKCEDKKYVDVCKRTCEICNLPVIDNRTVEEKVTETPLLQVLLATESLAPQLVTTTESTLITMTPLQTSTFLNQEIDFESNTEETAADVLYESAENNNTQEGVKSILHQSNIPDPLNCSTFLRNGVPIASYYPTPSNEHIIGVFLCPPGQTPTLFTCIDRKWTIGGHEAACGNSPFTAPLRTQPRRSLEEEEAGNLRRAKFLQGPSKSRTLVQGQSFVTPNLGRFSKEDICEDKIESLSCALLTGHCHTTEIRRQCAFTCGLCVTSDITVFNTTTTPHELATMQTPCEDSLPTKQCQANINFCNDPVFRIELCPATCEMCDVLNS